ncbi:hypothetical protein OAT10_00145 [Luminiphilus sp.]|nr:hypothetical protein [Luminiphilus sp.]
MKTTNNIIKEDIFNNQQLNKTVNTDNELREFIVNYVGNKLDPKDDQVTVEMVVEVVAKEFPEFLLAVAEENWIRGYKQAFDDIEEGEDTPSS